MTNKVVVLGSLNVDTTLHIDQMPKPGETISAKSKTNSAGGKGANQAVAAARSGAQTSFIGQVGDDSNGIFMIDALKLDGINTDHVGINQVDGTGSAVILLDSQGQNSIMVYGGANQAMKTEVIADSQALIKSADILISEFETPQEVTYEAFKLAKQHGVTTILNPAPASKIIYGLLEVTDLIVPNETESATLTGIEVNDTDSMDQNAAKFSEMGIDNLIITVGDRGAYYHTPSDSGFVPAFKVKAKDTTAAGDTFIGAFSSQIDKDLSNIEAALVYAQKASSITVQRLGALPSIPTAEEIKAEYK
ncbi:ribokinase [Lentilactobacillus buchneri]|uniref:Ribokinase n=1 Tax=Lentilactobacillus buchneri subsp. silagei CD034 TaxID=1071400 RepID=J9W6H7_LENBU|nr:ribokinase [Lentilactobacillus buchneri]MCC6102035.1 ribokinase [Lactobacillus sp.]AFR99840.1 ribokinase [Lentilactobacillus buchneri subsp. silagei CD034]MCT2901662.1 ribokinase [Lentilactobacillus buchneri]MCT3543361.1 ribokinase [Lentilactobacillus buchneri]MCT3544019.1 ribokinase [Lentilactobacillus buchneri]